MGTESANGVTVPRPVVHYREPLADIHAFSDTSTQGVGAAVYAVIRQLSGTTQLLVAAKGRLAKLGLTVPRIEFVSANMATNLVTNVRNTLTHLPSRQIYACLDGTVASPSTGSSKTLSINSSSTTE